MKSLVFKRAPGLLLDSITRTWRAYVMWLDSLFVLNNRAYGGQCWKTRGVALPCTSFSGRYSFSHGAKYLGSMPLTHFCNKIW